MAWRRQAGAPSGQGSLNWTCERRRWRRDDKRAIAATKAAPGEYQRVSRPLEDRPESITRGLDVVVVDEETREAASVGPGSPWPWTFSRAR